MTKKAWLAVSLVALTLAAVSAVTAFRSSKPGASPSRGRTETPCVGTDCLTVAEVEALTGFEHLEPAYVPEGYVLFERRVPENRLTEEGRKRVAEVKGVPLDEVPATFPPNSVVLNYRFQGRGFVPAINILQSFDRGPEPVRVELDGDGCGQEVTISGHSVYYGEGLGRISRDDDAPVWRICPEEGDFLMSHVIFAKGNVLVELIAMPEAGLTREEILRIAVSMLN